MAAYPQQTPLKTAPTGPTVAKIKPEMRAFIVRPEEGGNAFITLCSFFRNKNGKLSGKASLRCKHADGRLEEMDSITLTKEEFVNLTTVD